MWTSTSVEKAGRLLCAMEIFWMSLKEKKLIFCRQLAIKKEGGKFSTLLKSY